MGMPLTSVSGVGPAAASLLAEHGFTSAEQLAASLVEDLVKVPGFGPVRAAAILRAARTLVEGRAGEAPGSGKKRKSKKKAKTAKRAKDKPKAGKASGKTEKKAGKDAKRRAGKGKKKDKKKNKKKGKK